jgi:peptide/nickel transport system permease protein
MRAVGIRCFSFLIKLLGITFCVYAVLYFAPGNRGSKVRRLESTIEEISTPRNVPNEMAFTHMVWDYGNWMGGILKGKFGYRYLIKHTGKTLGLVVGSLGLSLVIALTMVYLSLMCTERAMVRDLISLINLLSGMHVLVLSYLLIYWGWVSPRGFSFWLLLILALGNGALADYYSILREQTNKARGMEYVEAARGRGADVIRHLRRYEMTLGLIEATSSRFPVLIGSTIIVESIFSYLGLGYDIVNAIRLRNFERIMAITMVVAALLIFVTEFTDYIRKRLDPRLSS